MNHERHEIHENFPIRSLFNLVLYFKNPSPLLSNQFDFNTEEGVGPNVIRAERSERETDSEVSRFQSTIPLRTNVESVTAFSIARVL
ncbi:hypothetical protein Pan153_29070 [Gimesia panareensis]|uniref:Uncharacterized protein n=1 Tax=Gimesia panareensis TaxID=2527978 RepID=A0A518FPM0_9PLAN|nr:hypothetical protein Enr10x_09490 [Gimesia panareensis]QDU48597.1 hypothetical protein Pan110_09120 [Gimesia panareensis]QDV18250.1 hypothetical protein Pan153_29070 [Gimesia panareensis]